ncbi:MAG: hypothetical protein N3F09_05920, partial [Bacteroidia bacterium]|nr:hypothetical protein [Bacteroidia bacterium]
VFSPSWRSIKSCTMPLKNIIISMESTTAVIIMGMLPLTPTAANILSKLKTKSMINICMMMLRNETTPLFSVTLKSSSGL